MVKVPVFAAIALATLGLATNVAFSYNDATNDTVRISGSRAHFSREFCGMTDEQVHAYEAGLKRVYPDATSFAWHWGQGWRDEEHEYVQYRAFQLRDPVEFAKHKQADCARVERAMKIIISQKRKQ
jgi:hypothetical protein